jgi:hypothetical protein
MDVKEAEGAFLPRDRKWVCGLDLGQAADSTAFAACEWITGVVDPNSEWERHTGTGRLPQKPATRVHLRHLERLPLGMPYPTQVAIIKERMSREPLSDWRTKLLIDSTGVGRAVADVFAAEGLKFSGITITAGEKVTGSWNGDFHVSKIALISVLDAMLHTGTLQIAAELLEAEALRSELRDFQRHVSAAGRSSYNAREGSHDDLVLSVALCTFWISRPPPPTPVFGVYGRTGKDT